MDRRIGSLVAAILAIAIEPARALWLNVPTKGIPTDQSRQARSVNVDYSVCRRPPSA